MAADVGQDQGVTPSDPVVQDLVLLPPRAPDRVHRPIPPTPNIAGVSRGRARCQLAGGEGASVGMISEILDPGRQEVSSLTQPYSLLTLCRNEFARINIHL